MDVYFARHGETDGNVAFRHQHSKTALNEIGWEQGKLLAEEIKRLEPTHIISSTYLRAVQTSRFIIDCCDEIIPITHTAFEELHRPHELIGNRLISKTTMKYVWGWFFGKVNDGGESYQDFILRIREARTYLESLPEDSRVVIVSHSVFINIFLEHLCSDEPISFKRAVSRFWKILILPNASIVHLQYSNQDKNCGWKKVK